MLRTYDNLFPESPYEVPKGFVNHPRTVDEVLDLVKLTNKANSRIGKLSGGERKRLSIAVELLKRKEILILDEPDSGLDPYNRGILKSLLQKLKSEGVTIIISTHYPDVTGTYERTIILAKKNRIAADSKTCTPEEFDKAMGEYDGTFYSNRLSANTCSEEQKIDRRNLSPLWTLFFHDLRLHYRNWGRIFFLFFMPLACMILLRFVTSYNIFNTYRDAISVVFAMSCAAILIGLLFSINMVCKDRRAIYREIRNGVSTWAVIVSKSLFIIFACTIMSTILVFPYTLHLKAIGYSNYHLIYIFGAILITMIVSSEMGLFVSSLPRITSQLAACLIPFIMLFQILFSGILFVNNPLEKLKQGSISYYSINMIGSSLYLDRFEENPYISHTLEVAFTNILWLVLFFFVFMVLSFIWLKSDIDSLSI
jgi:hypothetical protein